jgi:GlpG protein
VTVSVLILATLGSLLHWGTPQAMDWAVADPWPIWEGQLWRFATTVFIHGNLIHLGFNLYWLWRFGRDVEVWMGSLLFAGFLLLVGAGSAAVEFLAFAHAGIGLSGVGYGLFGLLYALRRYKDFAAAQMQPQTVQFFVFWFFLCIVLTYTKLMPVANVAHGAGCVLGWLIGQAVLARGRVWLLAGLTVVVFGLIVAPLYMPWNGRYALYRGKKDLENRDYASALVWYEKAARAEPDNVDLHTLVRWLRAKGEEKDSP